MLSLALAHCCDIFFFIPLKRTVICPYTVCQCTPNYYYVQMQVGRELCDERKLILNGLYGMKAFTLLMKEFETQLRTGIDELFFVGQHVIVPVLWW